MAVSKDFSNNIEDAFIALGLVKALSILHNFIGEQNLVECVFVFRYIIDKIKSLRERHITEIRQI